MGSGASSTARVTREEAKELAGARWDEALWPEGAETIAHEELLALDRDAEVKSRDPDGSAAECGAPLSHRQVRAARNAYGKWARHTEMKSRDLDGGSAAAPLVRAADAGNLERVLALLAQKALVDEPLEDGPTPLWCAAFRGHLDVLNALLAHGADSNKGAMDVGSTPLLMAAGAGHIDALRALLAQGAQVDKGTNASSGWSPLLQAVECGHLDVVRELVATGAAVNFATEGEGMTPLCMGSLRGHLEIVRTLLSMGADSNKALTSDGAAPLAMASDGGHLEVVRALLEAGAEVDKASVNGGWTPLLQAAQNGHVHVVLELLAQRASVDKSTIDRGVSPLLLASHFGHLEVVQALLEGKADVNQTRPADGATSLVLALSNGHVEVALALLEKGADAQNAAKVNDGTASPLFLAAAGGHLKVVRSLLGRKADVDKGRTDTGITPLKAAVQNAHLDVVHELIAQKADVDPAIKGEETPTPVSTPMSIAVHGGNLELVRALVDAGAKVNTAGKNGATLLSIAAGVGDLEIAKVLLDQGADINDNSNHGTNFAVIPGHASMVALLVERKADLKMVDKQGNSPLYSALKRGHETVVEILREAMACTPEQRAAEARLLPLPPEVELCHKNLNHVHHEKLRDQIRAATPWLKKALVEAYRSPEIKAQAKRLLRLGSFTNNLAFAGVFDELQSHCLEAASAIGAEMKMYYERERLEDALGRFVLPEHPSFGASRRLDGVAVGLPLPPRREGEGDTEWESVVAHFVRLVARSVDGAFQAICAKVVAAHGGRCKPAPIKGQARMIVKATSDHRYEPLPRPALNIDVVRNACTFDNPDDLMNFAMALCAELGGAAGRVKNGFAASAGEVVGEYRTVMVNWIFAPGQTFGELARDGAAVLDRYLEAPPEDPVVPWGRWREHAARAVAFMRSAEVASRPVRFVCETQLLLKPYLEGRRKMHLLYKVVRAADVAKLYDDFCGGVSRWAKGATYESEQLEGKKSAVAKAEAGHDMSRLLGFYGFNGYLAAVEALLERGGDINSDYVINGNSAGTALLNSAFNGHVVLVQALLARGADVNKANVHDGMTPLYVSAQNDHLDVARVLLAEKADTEKTRTDTKETPLFIAASKGNVDMVKLLLANDADIGRGSTDEGETALHKAAREGYLDVVCTLLEAGADVNSASSKGGWTVLAYAASEGHLEVVRELLRRGAKIDESNDNGWTALLEASQRGRVDVVQELLANGGAVVDKASTGGSVKGATPLWVSMLCGHFEVVRVLLAHGANADQPGNADDSTPLFFAVFTNHLEIAGELLKHGADANKVLAAGATPLHTAALIGHVEMVELLLANGADASAMITKEFVEDGVVFAAGSTALQLATARGHEMVAAVLENNT